jgi:hypothetical protein
MSAVGENPAESRISRPGVQTGRRRFPVVDMFRTLADFAAMLEQPSGEQDVA